MKMTPRSSWKRHVQTSSPPDSFQDLKTLTAHLQAGKRDPTLVDRLSREYDVPINDLLEGAVSTQLEARRGLRGKVLEYVGRKMGEKDGEWGEMREDPDIAPTPEEIQRAAPMAGQLSRQEEASLEASVFRAYGRGLLYGAARAYARQHHRMHQLDQLSEAEALRGQQALESTELALREAHHQLQDTSPTEEVDDFAILASRTGMLLNTADELASERLEEETARRAHQTSRSDPEELLAQARLELRSQAAGSQQEDRQALQRAAWQPVRMSRIQRRVQKAQQAHNRQEETVGR